MNDHEQNQAQFPPQNVDEQIDELLWSRRQRKGSPAADKRLVSDLHVLYEAANAGTRERVWQRLVDHIASNDAAAAPYKQGPQERNFSTEGHHHMRNEALSPFARKQRFARRSRMWSIVAAVIVAALLVGSMTWIMTQERYHNTKSDVGTSNGIKRQQQTPAPASYSGIYVQTTNTVQRIDPKTGKIIWRYEIPFIPASYNKKMNLVSIGQFIVAGDTVYTIVTGPGGKNPSAVVALKSDTGQERWSQPLAGKSGTAPLCMALDDGVIYVGVLSYQTSANNRSNATNYNIYSFSAQDGKRGATYDVPGNSYLYALVVQKGILYIPTDKGLYAMDARSKKLLWSNSMQPEGKSQRLVIREPSILNGVLYTVFVSANETGRPEQSKVVAFSAKNGKLLWESAAFAGEASKPTIANGVIYVGSSIAKTGPFEGALYAYDATNGRQIWKVTTNGVQHPPSINNGVVYASAYAGMELKESVLAVDLKTGHKKWQHQIEKGITTTPYEQDGVVYEAAGFDKGKLYALHSGDGSQQWTLDIGASPEAVVIMA